MKRAPGISPSKANSTQATRLRRAGRFLTPIAWTVVAVALACRIAAVAAAPSTDRTVVMISLDGLSAYYLDDPKAEMPTLRALAAAGARATSMKASAPTVTWPNHTTLVTGVNPARHGVIANNYLDRATAKKVTLISDPVYDKVDIVKGPTLYDVAKAAGMKTAAIRWPATRNAPTLDWTLPDVMLLDLLRKYTTPALVTECSQAHLDLFGTEATKPGSETPLPQPTDEVATHIFNMVLRAHRPSLALLHLIDVDHTEHFHGPKSPDAYAAVKAADNQVREVWEELQRDFPNRGTLIVVSDHGFSPTKRLILPNVVLRQAKLIEVSGKKQIKGPVQIVPQGGAALVYVLDDAHRASIVDRVRKACGDLKGVQKVIGVEQFKEYGIADPKDDPRAPDLILFAEIGCAFGDTAAGELPFAEKPERKGSHGHDPNLPELQATFVAWGAGIKPGARLGEISNLSVAPTIARLLGLSLPNTEGKPLNAALTD